MPCESCFYFDMFCNIDWLDIQSFHEHKLKDDFIRKLQYILLLEDPVPFFKNLAFCPFFNNIFSVEEMKP